MPSRGYGPLIQGQATGRNKFACPHKWLRLVSLSLTGRLGVSSSTRSWTRIGKITLMAGARPTAPGKNLPVYVRATILLEAIVISFLSFWLFKEYLNNSYLRQYINNTLQANLPLYMLGLIAVSIVGAGAYARLRNLNKRGEHGFPPEPIIPSSLTLEVPIALPSRSTASVSLGSETSPSRSVNVSSPFLGEAELRVRSSDVLSSLSAPPVLKHVEQAPGVSNTLADPMPFPVIRRLEPLLESVEPVPVRPPEVVPPVLRRIEPRLPWVNRPPPAGRLVTQVEPGQYSVVKPYSRERRTPPIPMAQSQAPADDSPRPALPLLEPVEPKQTPIQNQAATKPRTVRKRKAPEMRESSGDRQ